MTLKTIERVGVVGAGTMGAGIAQVFAQHGFRVTLVDAAPSALDRAMATIERSLTKLAEKGLVSAETREAAQKAIALEGTLGALAPCDLIVEAVVESLEVKRAVFSDLARVVAPDALLASNTSSISITQLAAGLPSPGRVAGMHFMNPVPLMPLVEIIRGHATSNDTIASILAVTTALGKTGVEAADYPGFIANRILMPMINEAAFALMEGVGSADAIDTVMKLGMNHPMGPLALADFIGLDVCVAILDVMHKGLGDPKYRACPLLRRMVDAGQLGRKSGQGFFRYA